MNLSILCEEIEFVFASSTLDRGINYMRYNA
jgi:hypothetical protein